MTDGQNHPSSYWLHRLARRIGIGKSGLSCWAATLLIPAVIVLGHFLIALATNGLSRFINDDGLILTSAAWFSMLTSIGGFTGSYNKLAELLDSSVVRRTPGRGIGLVLDDRAMALSGALFALGELSIIFVTYPPASFVTGFVEIPYSGPPMLAMRYASTPAYIWTNSFWAFFFFIMGNCVWMLLSIIIVSLRTTLYSSGKADNRLGEQGGKVAASTLLRAVSSVTAPLVVLTPLAFSDSLDESLLPKLSPYYAAVGVGCAVLLVLAAISVLVLWKWRQS